MIVHFRYQVILTTFMAWFIAQTIKVVVGIIREKRFNFKWFVGTGGMPSSHSASVAALTTSVGLNSGLDSDIFVACLLFTVIVIFDAQGVRRATGQQAEILNKIIEDVYSHRQVPEERLKELWGHTPVEVFSGVALGIVVAFISFII